jgi:hypothetical protein
MRPNPLDSSLDVFGLAVRELVIAIGEQLEPMAKLVGLLDRKLPAPPWPRRDFKHWGH